MSARYENLLESQKNLIELEKKKMELMLKMQKALTLASMWEGLFDHGAAKSQWRGPAPNWHTGRKPEEEHKYHTFRVTAGNGESREFTYEEVPALLGGGRK